MRDKLIRILRTPIFPHELADPTEAVADYLLDNDVVPVVRCKNCKQWNVHEINGKKILGKCGRFGRAMRCEDFCSHGERREGDG